MKKTEFNTFWSNLLKQYSIKKELPMGIQDTIYKLLSESKLYKAITPEYHRLYLDYYILPPHGRKIKMLFVKTTHNNGSLPISKTKLCNDLFPPKTKKSDNDNHIQKVKQAARNIIEPQIREYRSSITLPQFCPLTLKKLTNWTQIHVDHVIPFSTLFEDWMDRLGINPLDINLSGRTNNKNFTDIGLQDSWFQYHYTNAKLQCLDKKANLIKSNKEFITD